MNQGSTDPPTPAPPPAPIRWLVALTRVLVPLILLAAAIYGAMLLLAAKPEPERAEVESITTLVETIVPETREDVAEIIAYGTIEPNRTLTLQAQVGGLVVGLNDALQPGGLVKAGERLLEIDPRDYELTVRQREADVANATVALRLEGARGLVAQREWELLGDSVETSNVGRELARREPQRVEKEVMLEAAESRLEAAILSLERTTVEAPFNGLVRQDEV